MRSRILGALALALGAAFAAASPVYADEITVSYSRSVSTGLHYGSAGGTDTHADDTDSGTWNWTTSASDDPTTSDTTTTVTTNSITFESAWTTKAKNGSKAASTAYADFTVDHDSSYSLTGAYSMSGTTGEAYMHVYLLDLTDGSLFSNWQREWPTDAKDFTLGEEGGNQGNLLTGSLTGTLLAGHSYQLYFNSFLYSRTGPAGGTDLTGSAWATLEIDHPVPEPSSIALLGLGLAGLAGLGLARRRRRTKAWHGGDRAPSD